MMSVFFASGMACFVVCYYLAKLLLALGGGTLVLFGWVAAGALLVAGFFLLYLNELK